jgi:hypothetical protein
VLVNVSGKVGRNSRNNYQKNENGELHFLVICVELKYKVFILIL